MQFHFVSGFEIIKPVSETPKFERIQLSVIFQFLDGVDIRSLELSWLRSRHAVVSHRSFLPHCSIAENIAYGDNSREITRREIEDAAYSAYAHEFITNLIKVRNWTFAAVTKVLLRSWAVC